MNNRFYVKISMIEKTVWHVEYWCSTDLRFETDTILLPIVEIIEWCKN